MIFFKYQEEHKSNLMCSHWLWGHKINCFQYTNIHMTEQQCKYQCYNTSEYLLYSNCIFQYTVCSIVHSTVRKYKSRGRQDNRYSNPSAPPPPVTPHDICPNLTPFPPCCDHCANIGEYGIHIHIQAFSPMQILVIYIHKSFLHAQ